MLAGMGAAIAFVLLIGLLKFLGVSSGIAVTIATAVLGMAVFVLMCVAIALDERDDGMW